jgi:hypothetical protein
VKNKSSQLNKEKKKPYTKFAKVYGKTESSICEMVKKEKEICANFAVALQTENIMATVLGVCLGKTGKVLNYRVEY